MLLTCGFTIVIVRIDERRSNWGYGLSQVPQDELSGPRAETAGEGRFLRDRRLDRKEVFMCDCIKKVNAQLKKHNTVLSLSNTINHVTGKMGLVLEVPTAKINPRKKKLRLFPIHCVFCGEKLQNA